MAAKQQIKFKLALMKSSSIKTQEKKNMIKGEHEVDVEIKRNSMM